MARRIPTTIRSLNRLAMLADWQLLHRGHDPHAITLACLERDAELSAYRAQRRGF